MQTRNFTQAQLAEKAETTQTTISRYLNGKASPKAEELFRISRALGVSMEWLLTGQDTDGSPKPALRSPTPSAAAKRALKKAQEALQELKDELDS